MKKEYIKPIVEVQEFELEDMLTGSGVGASFGGDNAGDVTNPFSDLF